MAIKLRENSKISSYKEQMVFMFMITIITVMLIVFLTTEQLIKAIVIL